MLSVNSAFKGNRVRLTKITGKIHVVKSGVQTIDEKEIKLYRCAMKIENSIIVLGPR